MQTASQSLEQHCVACNIHHALKAGSTAQLRQAGALLNMPR
jgi:hypothetical protein